MPRFAYVLLLSACSAALGPAGYAQARRTIDGSLPDQARAAGRGTASLGGPARSVARGGAPHATGPSAQFPIVAAGTPLRPVAVPHLNTARLGTPATAPAATSAATPTATSTATSTAGHLAFSHAAPSHEVPGSLAPGHARSVQAAPGRAAPGQARSVQAAPGHAAPGHASVNTAHDAPGRSSETRNPGNPAKSENSERASSGRAAISK
jgi:hypothetical protein